MSNLDSIHLDLTEEKISIIDLLDLHNPFKIFHRLFSILKETRFEKLEIFFRNPLIENVITKLYPSQKPENVILRLPIINNNRQISGVAKILDDALRNGLEIKELREFFRIEKMELRTTIPLYYRLILKNLS